MNRTCTVLMAAFALAAIGRSTEAQQDNGHAISESEMALPRLHHVGLNSTDPDAAIAWYMRLWPTAKRTTVAGYPALQTDMLLLFNKVSSAPGGAFHTESGRSEPQSAFWHIGGSIPAASRAELEARGLTLLPLFVQPENVSKTVWRSGLAPYAGTKTADEIARGPALPPREGGFSYVVGPDGALIELTTAVTAMPTFSHMHFLHEQPLCAVNWYVDNLGMVLPPAIDSAGSPIKRTRFADEECAGDYGEPSWPSLQSVGTIRQPLGIVRYADGSLTWYPRQCVDGRCNRDEKLVPSRGQVLDHVAFTISNFDAVYARMREHGVKVLMPPYEFGTSRAFMVEDPDGLAIELIDGGPVLRKRPN